MSSGQIGKVIYALCHKQESAICFKIGYLNGNLFNFIVLGGLL